MKTGRTEKSLLNMATGLISKGMTYIIRFVLRTVFIYTLTSEYLGVSSVFSSILTLLSLTDLGFSIALPFSLYKPLAENDTKRVNMIMRYYSKIYLCVGGAVLVIGLGLTPFLPLLIAETTIDNITLIYVLYVLQTAASYLFIYRKTLITADQKSYVVTTIDCICQIITCTAQIIVLVVFKSFIGYLIISIAGTILTNLVISQKCLKYYPYLKEPCHEKLSKNEKRLMTKRIGSLAVYKIAIAVETSISSVIITKFMGLSVAGIWSNYVLVITSVSGILQIVLNSLTASIGNLISEANNEKIYKIYRTLNYISYWAYGVVSICIYVLIQSFVGDIWIDNTYLISDFDAALMVLSAYICGTQNMNGNFRDAYGLFWEGRYRPIIMIALQIGLSTLFASWLGIAGVYIGIILSRLLSVGIIDPIIVHKYGLHKNCFGYYKDYFGQLILAVAVAVGFKFVFSFIPSTSILMWVIKGVVVFLASNLIYLMIFIKSDSVIFMKEKASSVIEKIGARMKK